jgi:parallel beta-helix repeat protein
LGLSSSIGSWGEGTLAQAQGDCTVTVQPGESIQQAIDQAAEGDVICLEAGTWEENVKIEKSLTIRGMGAEQTVIDGVQEGYPVVWITTPEEAQTVSIKVEGVKVTGAEGECADWYKGICAHGLLIRGQTQVAISDSTISGNGKDGIWLRDSARAEISNSTISENEHHGIWLGGSAQAEITNSTISGNSGDGIELGGTARVGTRLSISGSTISGNWHGIWLAGSAQAEIEGNTIFNNGSYGVVLYQQPCYPDMIFKGHVSGKQNTIPGPPEPDGNGKGAVCPEELDFLMTEEGGEYKGQ